MLWWFFPQLVDSPQDIYLILNNQSKQSNKLNAFTFVIFILIDNMVPEYELQFGKLLRKNTNDTSHEDLVDYVIRVFDV